MNNDDLIYASLLLFSITFGYFIRLFKERELRKWVSTLVGLLLVFVVSGFHIVHPLICTLINALIIVNMDKTTCAKYSFAFQFGYLAFFRTTEYFGIPYPPAHTNLVQMVLTLKLVGLAFEVQDTAVAKAKARDKSEDSDTNIQEVAASVSPGFMDIFHYAFTHVGVLTGPFYTYRTYNDWLHTPFSDHAPCFEETLRKLKWLPLFLSLFLTATYFYPLQYAKSDEFYSERSFWYRLWYTYPSFFIFRMRIYSGLIMSECVCTMAGLGAYPVATAPVAGQGPSKDFALLRQVVSDPEQAKKATYNFETIHNIDPYGSEFIPTLRQSMKSWNICIQYWLAVNVYKRLPRNAFRTTVTLFVSAFWHGIYAGYYLCICTVALYLPVEDLYVKHFTKGLGGMAGKIADFVVWFFRLQALSYMAITFFLLTIHDSFKYWNSIYFCCHVLWAAFYMVGVVAVKARKKSNMEKDKSI
ncbi:lysophospholipid acyltransferase 7 isoform X1 [Bacillus rossius redtenbacheri]|uniref:lysophospholipid acyltransferase 7 isoform X1 n=1 Tax=Bacillus rossius redtenbacheri TaxID=93214 RepID=UPI002FDCCB78